MNSWLLFFSGGMALALLAGAMTKHQRHIFVTVPSEHCIRVFKVVAWAILGVGLGGSVLQWGATVGISRWLMLMTFSALAVALLMTYFPQRFQRFLGVMTSAVTLLLLTALFG